MKALQWHPKEEKKKCKPNEIECDDLALQLQTTASVCVPVDGLTPCGCESFDLVCVWTTFTQTIFKFKVHFFFAFVLARALRFDKHVMNTCSESARQF